MPATLTTERRERKEGGMESLSGPAVKRGGCCKPGCGHLRDKNTCFSLSLSVLSLSVYGIQATGFCADMRDILFI